MIINYLGKDPGPDEAPSSGLSDSNPNGILG
jgi:hypothetical protein